MKTAVIQVTGNIHEVGYRTRVMGIAQILNVNGYVRNLPDSKVEIVAQASQEILEKFIKKIKIQDEMIHVDATKIDYSETFDGFKDFHKIVGPNETDSRLDKAVDQLKEVVAAIKELKNEVKEGNQELVKEIKEGNQELVSKMDQNHTELITEIRGIREDNSEKVMNELKETLTNEIHKIEEGVTNEIVQKIETLFKESIKQS